MTLDKLKEMKQVQKDCIIDNSDIYMVGMYNGMEFSLSLLEDKEPEYMDCAEANTFEKELESLINKFSKENLSNTPDFILAEYLNNCLTNFNSTLSKREKWYGRPIINKEEAK